MVEKMNYPFRGGALSTMAHRPAVIDETRWQTGKEIALTWAGIFFTFAACVIVLIEQGPILLDQIKGQRWGVVAAHALILLIIAFLIYGSFVYQATRLGYLKRRRQHAPAPRAALNMLFEDERKPLTILVPSYREDRRVIFQTLMSAALQEYPQRRVVLLVDDPPRPTAAADVAQLAESRELPLHIAALLAQAAKPFNGACAAYVRRAARGENREIDAARETVRVVELWQQAGAWFARAADDYPVTDHTDRLYVDKVLRSRADAHAHHAGLLLKDLSQGKALDDAQLLTEYRKRVAVVQTPYSAIPGAPSELERIAGATTDMQYIIHQGFTQHNATYWVGANALLRHTALKEIAVREVERGYPVQRFIQDRTVIDDTDSSVDLSVRGWRLYNYPERLAYSATPPDFGSLIIQRRRWANGGLIILPKLLGYLFKRPQVGAAEALLRTHYLLSIAAVNIGLLLMLAFPFGESIESVLLPLSALPYFWLYGRDLRLCGYRRTDLFKIYALNLLLIPVNLGGVLKSVQQGYSGKKIPFGRTPKVQGRTAAPPLYIIAGYVLFAQWAISGVLNFHDGHYAHAIFAVLSACV